MIIRQHTKDRTARDVDFFVYGMHCAGATRETIAKQVLKFDFNSPVTSGRIQQRMDRVRSRIRNDSKHPLRMAFVIKKTVESFLDAILRLQAINYLKDGGSFTDDIKNG